MSAAEPIDAPSPLPRNSRAIRKRARWWQRRGSSWRSYRYVNADGRAITDAEALGRIRALVIPPGWRNVLVSPSSRSRVQAIGVDSLGRVQYRYHPAYRLRRQAAKYDKIVRFARRLPELRAVTNRHVAESGLGRERVLAVVVRLINDLYFRVGCERNVRRYRTYGITTLRCRHLTVRRGGRLEFSYVGKHHVRLRRVLVDPRLAELVGEIKRLHGRRLFCYRADDGSVKPITARDVNEYIQRACGEEFTAKDFRTWGGTLLAAIALAEIGPAPRERARRQCAAAAMRRVAERLGNTPTVCRNCYVHPLVLERYASGVTLAAFRPRAERAIRHVATEYEVEEVALLELLGEKPAVRSAAA